MALRYLQSFGAKLLKPNADQLIAAVCSMLICLMLGRIIPQSDTWWLLRAGQEIVTTFTVSTTETWSLTVPGAYWPNHEWLSEVLFFGLYQLGGLAGVWWGCALVVALTWLFIFWLCEGPLWVRAVIISVGVLAQQSAWSMRPQLLSMLLFAIGLLLLPHKKLRWLYPVLFLVWANVHAGVAFGGLILFGAITAALWSERAELPSWLLIGLASALATLINPLGVGLWQYIFDTFSDTTRTYLSEWQPPSLDNLTAYPFFGFATLWAIAAFYTWLERHETHIRTILLIGLATLLLSSRSLRHSAMFVLAATPLLSLPLAQVPPLRIAALQLRPPVSLGVFSILALAAGLGTWALWNQQPDHMPLSPTILNGVATCSGPMYNSYEDGGPLVWFAPEHRIFVDNRQDPYPGELLLQAAQALQTGNYQQLFATYQLTCALVPRNSPLDQALQRDGWQVQSQDATHIVLHKAE